MIVIKKDGTKENFDINKIKNAVNKSAYRALITFDESDLTEICELVLEKLQVMKLDKVPISLMHNIVESALDIVNPVVAKSYKDYRNYKQDFVGMLDKVYVKSQAIMYIGDKENSNTDSTLVSTKRSLIFNYLNKELYQKFFLTTEELQACNDGYIYIHDMSARRDTMNCCLFDVGSVLKDGFEMGNVWYNEPNTLDTAFDVIGDIVLSAASQQYGGFTIPEVDKLLRPYAEKSYNKYLLKYRRLGINEDIIERAVMDDITRDFEQGFQGWEYKFNTVGSSRGDYPFITITFGLGTNIFEKLASISVLKVREGGQGKPNFKKPVLFPKLVFLYDETLHGEGCELEDVFNAGISCSSKTMYPDWLSLTGDGYVASMYKKYKKPISPMGCVAGDSVVLYKVDNIPHLTTFEGLWDIVGEENPELEQIKGNHNHLYIDTEKCDVFIYDTMRGFVKVKKVIRNTSYHWYNITLSDGRVLTCTSGHPLPVVGKGRVYAKDIVVGDQLTVNRSGYKLNDIVESNINLDELFDSIISNINNEPMIFDFYRVLRLSDEEKIWFIHKLHSHIYGTSNTKELNELSFRPLSYSMVNIIITIISSMYNSSMVNYNIKLSDYTLRETTSRYYDMVISFENFSRDEPEYLSIVDVNGFIYQDYSYDVETESDFFEVNGIYSHNCRAFLSPWYERGGMTPQDENDEPIFLGRFNIGAISLHLPMILAKSRQENKNFYEILDYYLNLIRKLHLRTYDYLGEMKASVDPLAYCEGGFYGGHLGIHDKIKPILKSATASFGITALNELQRLYNGKSLIEDNEFALDVMEFINRRINEFKEEDGRLYAIYGTPAESLCGLQIEQFRKKYGIIEGVSDKPYVSNSFHCHVSEDITPIDKQDREYEFWNFFNGGKIQYVRYPIAYNIEAIKTLVRRAMSMGFYEGVNLSLSYCNNCGHQELSMDTCPKCGSSDLTKIDRMNGYLSYSRVKGDTRLNKAKMAELADRRSM